MDTSELNLEYPCPWNYQVIGESEERLRAAVAAVVGHDKYVLTFSNRSTKGRYISLQLTVEVRDEDQRHGLFHALKRHEDIRFVL